jgi:hypothetical protein
MDRFLEKAQKVHGTKYDYTNVKYINCKEKIEIICPEHGSFWQLLNDHLRGCGCSKCAGVHKKDTNEFIEKAQEVHGFKYNYSKVEYQNANTKIEIICPEHGSFFQKPISHVRGSGCIKCVGKNIPTTEEWILKAHKVHGSKYNYSKVIYINCKTKVEILCSVHGSFFQTPYHHLRGVNCSKCSGVYKYVKEDFIAKANVIHNNKYEYSKVEYINSNTSVEIICPEHGSFWQKSVNHLRGYGCLKCVGKNKTNEEWIENANKIHNNKYDYSKVEYINARTKVEIICPEHGSFFQKPISHVRGSGCIKCAGYYSPTTEEWIERAQEVHGSRYDYSNVVYTGCDNKVEIICSVHGSFWQMAISHLRGSGCIKCAGYYSPTTEEWILKAQEVHGFKYDYSKIEYKDANNKVEILCSIHGSFWQMANSHLQGNGCSKCVGHYSPTTEEWIERAQEVHGSRYDYSNVVYTGCDNKVEIICSVHGSFFQTSYGHIQGHNCPKCSKKGFSQKAIKWLEYIMSKENIHIEHAMNSGEYQIPDTRLRADGYCPDSNTIYEFHGTIYHGDPRICDPEDCNYLGKNYKDLYDKTLKKEEKIKELGFNLVTMWELDYDNLNNQ